MSDSFVNLPFNLLIEASKDSVVGSVAALYYFLLIHRIINLKELKILSKSGLIEFIIENCADALIPKKARVALNLDEGLAVY